LKPYKTGTILKYIQNKYRKWFGSQQCALAAMDILPILRGGEYKLFDRYNSADYFEMSR